MAVGARILCARSKTHRMFCSGSGLFGQTGTGSYSPWTSYNVLTEVNPSISTWEWGPLVFDKTVDETVVAGLGTSSFPLDLYSWGLNDHGQGGSGSPGTNLGLPTAVVYNPVQFDLYSVGSRHACGIDSIGRVFCIGRNAAGTYSRVTPVFFVNNEYVDYCLHIRMLSSLFQFAGELGDATNSNALTPPFVQALAPGMSAATAVYTGSDYTCTINTGGKAWCWGRGGTYKNIASRAPSNLTGSRLRYAYLINCICPLCVCFQIISNSAMGTTRTAIFRCKSCV